MGFMDDVEEVEKAATGQGGNDGDNNANGSNGDSKKGEDTVVDSFVDQFATKEGVPAGFDPEVNNLVNDEVNKF